MKTLEKIICGLTLAAAAVFGSSCDDNGGGNGGGNPPPTYTWEETQKNSLMHEGVVLTSWWYDDYLRPQVDFTLEYLHDLGVESVAILATQYQYNSTPSIYSDLWKTPMDSGIEHVIQKAKSLGMRTVLKPHVDPNDGSWRGNITFSSEAEWTSWFISYRNFILHYAQLAEDNGVDMLVIGTELAGTTHRDAEWNQLINDIRLTFSGEITYAADNDNYQTITWWNRLDYIGVNAYFPLTTSSDPTLSDLINEWDLIAQDLEAFSQAQGKQIILTEVGYQSIDGTNITPWWSEGPQDLQEQADCHEAALSTTFNATWNNGYYVYMCYHKPWINVDNFDFAAKPAETTISTYYHSMD